jgi:hypothetical protein
VDEGVTPAHRFDGSVLFADEIFYDLDAVAPHVDYGSATGSPRLS